MLLQPLLPPPVLITIYRFLYIFFPCKQLLLSLSVNYVQGSSTSQLDLPSINARVKPRLLRRRRMRNMNKSWWKWKRRDMVCSLLVVVLVTVPSYISLSTATSSDAALLAARNQPRRMRAWENPKLRGKPPVKTLAAKTVNGEI
jgi:hypothetical protein